MLNRPLGDLLAQGRNTGWHVIVHTVNRRPQRDAADDGVERSGGHAVGARTGGAEWHFQRTPAGLKNIDDQVSNADELRLGLRRPIGRFRTQILRRLLHIEARFRPRLNPAAILQPEVGLQHG